MKKIITKRNIIIFVLIIIVILISVSLRSCMVYFEHLPDDVIAEKTLNNLKNKYNQDFVVTSVEAKSWAYHTNKVYLKPKGRDDQPFQAWGQNDFFGVYKSRDNYFQYIIRDEYEKAIEDMLKEYFADFKVYMHYQSGVFPNGLNYGTKLEDIYTFETQYENSFDGDFIVFVRESELNGKDIKDILYKIAQKRVEKKLVGDVQLTNVFDDKYNLIDRENWSDDHSQLDRNRDRDLGLEREDHLWYYYLYSIKVDNGFGKKLYDYELGKDIDK